MIRLAERTWPEAARLARDPRSVVLLPLGAIEQHGPHLPLLVDWLGAEELARRVAPHLRRGGFRPIVLPGVRGSSRASCSRSSARSGRDELAAQPLHLLVGPRAPPRPPPRRLRPAPV